MREGPFGNRGGKLVDAPWQIGLDASPSSSSGGEEMNLTVSLPIISIYDLAQQVPSPG
jgi:hypothetical protein